jgi:hypothetical protein
MGGGAVNGWQVGDLALCVNDTPTKYWGYCPVKKGGVYKVVGFDLVARPNSDLGNGIGLFLEGVGVSVKRFRKIKPDAEPCEEEFTVLIKRMKPAKVKS